MDPQDQPGSLGFAYVPIVSNTIDVSSLVLRGVLTEVLRTDPGVFRIQNSGEAVGPFGICITPIGFRGDWQLQWESSTWSGLVLSFFSSGGDPTDPENGFTINILPI